ncbi:ACP S-malonyltransferase [Sphaerotilus sp.]|uniref:ACP S-malonyltransferase n=1 Tax=Sphaerotilus sp. TaxID=2093942 RepID=UPI0025DDAE35|nr:acyltransferase domain-containing protein [Sphaerotilus sp.]
MSLGLLIPGQGTQHPAMLPWLLQDTAPDPTLDRLTATLGADWRTRLADPAWTTRNGVAQPLITGLALALWARLRAQLPAPIAVAGYSVGEVAAFSIAGVFDADTAMDLAQARAQAMNDAAAHHPAGGLLAVRDLACDTLAPVLQRHGLAVAIRLGPQRCIVGGAATALDAAERALVAGGVSCTRLGVQIASHTPMLAEAVHALAAVVETRPFTAPPTALVCNATGEVVRRPAALRDAFARQVAQTVPWDRCMEALAERGVQCVLELGPGTTLSKMWRERFPAIAARSADEFTGPAAVIAWVRQQIARAAAQ